MRKKLIVVLAFCLICFVAWSGSGTAILKTSEINSYLFGDRLLTAKNIPYSFEGFSSSSGYSVVVPKYYPLPKVNVDSETVESLFLSLNELPYVADQADARLIFSDGGNCQSFSVYMVTALRKLGYEAGYLPYPEHVCLWVVVNDAPYRIDITTNEFVLLGYKDMERLRSVLGEQSWMK